MALRLAELERFLEYVQEIRSPRRAEGERRSQQRYPLAMMVDYIPLDESLSPCGRPRKGITRDLSRDGIGMFSEAPVSAPFARVKLPPRNGRRAELLVKVLRCERLDFLFDVGGRIVDVAWLAGWDETLEPAVSSGER
jgi:hypothetical protein